MIKAILIKPLDGKPAGTEREFEKHDFDRLKALGAVRAAPTKTADAKAAPTVQNKMAPEVANKADVTTATVKAPAPKAKGK